MSISLIKEESAHILRVLPILLKKDEQFKNSLYTVFSETFVKKDDFSELKEIVKELALAQKETQKELKELTVRVDGLAVAQKRTEQRIEELAVAQKRTEQRIEELAVAQKKTEQRLDSLTQRVEELTIAMNEGFKNLSDSISSLGSRWGIHNEATFRNTIRGIFKHQEGFE
ncbi:MAG: DUF3782 domain-containing protein, partial [Candidatus Desantisbacteria bacterium]